ncbi:glutamate--tRNA ligase [Phycicoccus endophyticus]|uniref:Glutamate--tRNA ligase n=1 Tax=Phycicoccus endophyticus TaxID=1690220 RepID=A0A7G9QYC7_9MICO|nr:glutamate--tRNA ligase [Phycicoccus endophyticus]NHI19245.1 glutamate--tRNA ligase [Phycicoccus endophyticus]QNN48352.1 glutamate--tRNA ligase [Phycicoccus endophyticus]GGL41274.1 glutamate--tRNA ligase [Phycicoccus endophyticus]
MSEQTPAPTPAADLPGPVRLRVAPSPTGDPHVGTAYMSLFNLAFARQQGGRFILRIEDTDRARFREDSEQQVFDTLRWLGLTWDEGPDVGGPCAPYRQSERLTTYRPYVERLLAEGHAYRCWCTPERLAEMRAEQQRLKQPTGYDRMCLGRTEEERRALPGFSEHPVVRMLVPDDVELGFEDLIRGHLTAPRPDDQVILKADGFPTYHLAVVVDDHEMGITHVVRGEEWISSTPKHVLLYRWLGLEPPAFAHMPLLRNENKSKISKRKNPEARLTWFEEEGYLPEALVNFLGLLAYPPAQDAEGNDVEVFSFADFVDRFDWREVNPVGPIFDLKKLDWLNGVHIRGLDLPDLTARLLPYLQRDGVLGADPSLGELARLEQVTALIQTRIAHLTEASDLVAPFYVADDAVEVAEDARAQLTDDAARVLDAAYAALEAVPDEHGGVLGSEATFRAPELEAALRAALVDGLGLKPRLAFGPVRTALSGRRVSPPLFESMEILGKASTLTRLATLRATL